ncbi:MAG: hypothetical protein ABIW58_08050 [Sphingomicrobium sp.]
MAQSPQLTFYLARAAQANADAEAATLDNVRDRCRRSEEAWTILAERAARTEKMRTGSSQASLSEQLIKEHHESDDQDDAEQ